MKNKHLQSLMKRNLSSCRKRKIQTTIKTPSKYSYIIPSIYYFIYFSPIIHITSRIKMYKILNCHFNNEYNTISTTFCDRFHWHLFNIIRRIKYSRLRHSKLTNGNSLCRFIYQFSFYNGVIYPIGLLLSVIPFLSIKFHRNIVEKPIQLDKQNIKKYIYKRNKIRIKAKPLLFMKSSK